MIKRSKKRYPAMYTTIQILDALKDKLGSDYKTAKIFGIQQTRITKMRHHGGILTDEQALKAAEILGFPEEAIILSITAERSANSPAYTILTRLADKFDTRKVASFAAFLLVPAFVYFGADLANLTLV